MERFRVRVWLVLTISLILIIVFFGVFTTPNKDVRVQIEEAVAQVEQRYTEANKNNPNAPAPTRISARQTGPKVYMGVIESGNVRCIITYERWLDGLNQDCFLEDRVIPELKIRQFVKGYNQ